MKNLGLYLHIPFCQSKCPYCDFYSLDTENDYPRYANALMAQISSYSGASRDYTIDTIYIGGGTPSVIPDKIMYDILDSVYKNYKVLSDAETTIEVNPATVNLAMLKKYRKMGINRISFGAQSMNNGELMSLGRIHNSQDVIDTYNLARKAGFDNISIDVMYGIPDQTPESLAQTLEQICDLGPEHISLYGLKIEEGTVFAVIQDELKLPDENTEYKMYEDSIKYLAKRGYSQYEISNFAKPGFESKHNLRYWLCGEYLGLGPGAHSYFNGTRFSFKRGLFSYLQCFEEPGANVNIVDENYKISPNERVGEYIMLSLRLNRGLNTDEFKLIFGLDFEKMYQDLLSAYIEGGFMVHRGRTYAFTTKGMFVSNYILSSMLDFDSSIEEGIANGSDK